MSKGKEFEELRAMPKCVHPECGAIAQWQIAEGLSLCSRHAWQAGLVTREQVEERK